MATKTNNTAWVNGSYINDITTFILNAEGFRTSPYFEGVSIAIGYGYDLLQHKPAQINAAFTAIGIPILTQQQKKLLIDASRSKSMMFRRDVAAELFEINIDASQAQSLFEYTIYNEYSARLEDRILKEKILDSKEKVGLVSSVYNGKLAFSPLRSSYTNKLSVAYNKSDRSEIWYILRYDTVVHSSAKFLNGYAKRSFAEAAQFGLYEKLDKSSDISLSEAESVYRMLTRHRAC